MVIVSGILEQHLVVLVLRKNVIFDGRQIRKLLEDPSIITSMNGIENPAWKVQNFSGNNKADN